MRAARRRSRGVTLVEVTVIVVIVAILSVIAIVGYRRYIAASRTHEAINVLTSIKTAQFEYKAERGVFASVSSSLSSFYPDASPGQRLTQWGGPCGNCVEPEAWHKLKVNPGAPVRFGYATVDGIGGLRIPAPEAISAPEVSNALASVQAIKAGEPYFVAIASADTDANGTSCIAMAMSHTSAIVVSNEAE